MICEHSFKEDLSKYEEVDSSELTLSWNTKDDELDIYMKNLAAESPATFGVTKNWFVMNSEASQVAFNIEPQKVTCYTSINLAYDDDAWYEDNEYAYLTLPQAVLLKKALEKSYDNLRSFIDNLDDTISRMALLKVIDTKGDLSD